jgi:hypothetical protein
MESTNTAARLEGGGAYFSFPDPGPNSFLDFTNGDDITLEAWVNVSVLKGGDVVTVVGKGRTGASGFTADNQNWALRLREVAGGVHNNFLFATPRKPDPSGQDAHWHRWTALEGFEPKSGWHHLAVTYDNASGTVLQYFDGREVGREISALHQPGRPVVFGPCELGNWGLPTQGHRFPIRTLNGAIDEFAIYQSVLSPAELQTMFEQGKP